MSIIHGIDSAANNSDKRIVVPAGEMWRVDWVHAALVCTATVGNRRIVVALHDSAGISYGDWQSGVVQTAGTTGHYTINSGGVRETAFTNLEVQVVVPGNLVVPSGWYLRVYDYGAVDATADDLTLSYQFTKLVGN